MIDFRYHVVSLVSVFLALAVGIVLGAGPLKGTISDTLSNQVDQLRKDTANLHTELQTSQNATANRDAFTAAVLPTLVGQQLGGTSVVLVTVPGAHTDAIKPLTQALQASGATVTGEIDIKDAWTDPGRAKDRTSLLRTLTQPRPSASSGAPTTSGAAPGGSASAASLGSAPVTSPPAVTFPPAVTTPPAAPTPSVPDADATETALAAQLAQAVVTAAPAPAAQLGATSRSVVDALSQTGMIGLAGDLGGPATEAVVLVPGVDTSGQQPSPAASGSDPIADWAALAAGLDARSDGAVVVGPASSAITGGVVAAIRAEQSVSKVVSTVDTGGTPMGDVTTVLALREQSLGGAGSYGFTGKVDGPLPIRPGAKP
jgi:Copper transport outer membrane protein, MctB